MTVAPGQHVGDLPVIEPQVEPSPRNTEAVLSQAPHNRIATDEGSVTALSGIEPQRVSPGGKVAPIYCHPASSPEPVVTLEANSICHNDVRLACRSAGLGRVVFDAGSPGRIHLQSVADAFDHAVVVESGTGEFRPALEVVGHYPATRFPLLTIFVIHNVISIHADGTV